MLLACLSLGLAQRGKDGEQLWALGKNGLQGERHLVDGRHELPLRAITLQHLLQHTAQALVCDALQVFRVAAQWRQALRHEADAVCSAMSLQQAWREERRWATGGRSWSVTRRRGWQGAGPKAGDGARRHEAVGGPAASQPA